VSDDLIRDKGGLQQFYDDPKVVGEYLKRKESPIGAVLHAGQVEFLNGVIRDLKPRRLLEIAPGPARLSAEIDPVPLAVAMDFSANMLAEARRRTRALGRPHWHFARGDGFRLPFKTASFDFVFSIRFIRRFEREGRDNIYREIRRVLRPGGHLVLDAQNRLVAGPHRESRDGYNVFDELWLRDELIAELEAAGFAPLHLEGLIRRFALQWQLHRLRRFRLGGLAQMLIRALEWTPADNPSTWMVLSQARGD
jgi:ubiquinone/menaquinone biosynthesis C-methylase UbiE